MPQHPLTRPSTPNRNQIEILRSFLDSMPHCVAVLFYSETPPTWYSLRKGKYIVTLSFLTTENVISQRQHPQNNFPRSSTLCSIQALCSIQEAPIQSFARLGSTIVLSSHHDRLLTVRGVPFAWNVEDSSANTSALLFSYIQRHTETTSHEISSFQLRRYHGMGP